MRSAPASQKPADETRIDLWTIRLAATADEVAEFRGVLSDDEILRANKFKFEKHRNDFIVGRGLLRSILGWYLGLSASRVGFDYGPHGKPSLSLAHTQRIFFNLAHSHECILYAFNRKCELGVDVEFIRDLPEIKTLADHYFTPREHERFVAVPQEQSPEAFFNCWTRKEAYFKAIGKGLSSPSDSCEVSLAPGEPAVFLRLAEDQPASEKHPAISDWKLFHLSPMPGYIGALAIPSVGCIVNQEFQSVAECIGFLRRE